MDNDNSIMPIRGDLVKQICVRLERVERLTELLNSAGRFDSNHTLEDYFCGLFNIVYNLELINLNYKKKNFPAIDLGDDNSKIAIQVTKTTKRDKVNKTINTFIEAELYKKYDYLWIFVIGKKTKFRKSFYTQDKFVFDFAEHVIDLKDITNKVSDLNDDKLKQLVEYLDKKHNYFSALKAIKETKKIEYRVTNDFIERKWLSKDDVNRYRSSLSKSNFLLSPIDVVSDNRKITLLSEAGYGKTEETKHLANQINKFNDDLFAFHYELNLYDNQEIVKLIPKSYLKLPIGNIVFVLDGFDELGTGELKNRFRKKIESFCNENKDSKVIVSSRTNNYKVSMNGRKGTLNDFNEFFIESLSQESVNDFLRKNRINTINFWKEIHEKLLYSLMTNVFFVKEIVKLYEGNSILPQRQLLFDNIISETNERDIEHYSYSNNEDEFDDLPNLLKKAGFVCECLESNIITDEEFKKLFVNSTERELVKKSSLWLKKIKSWSFSHNNFGEYFAASLLKELPFEKYRSIISNDRKLAMLRPSWMNTISFLLSISDDIELIEWIINNNMELLGDVESHRLDKKTKLEIFYNKYNYYKSKKIWMPYEIFTTIRKAELIVERDQIELLIDDLNRNEHYTQVENAINVMSCISDTFDMFDKIKTTLIKLCASKMYRTNEIMSAIEVLSDFSMINQAELEDIISTNTDIEDQYLRTAYFYAINSLGLDDEMIDYVLVCYKKTMYNSNEETDLVNQSINYEKVISSIRSAESVKKLISYLIKNKEEIEYSSTIISGLSNSLKNNFEINEEIIVLIYKLYHLLDRTLNSELEIVVSLINSLGINKSIVVHWLDKKIFESIYSIERIIDQDSIEYIEAWYYSPNFDKSIAESIIIHLSIDSERNTPIFKVHKELVGGDRRQILIDREQKRDESDLSKEKILDAIFDKSVFSDIIQKFNEKHFEGVKIKVDDVLKLKKDYHNVYSELDRELINLLRIHFNSKAIVCKEMLDDWEWDVFILCALYRKHASNKDFVLSEFNQNKLENICYRVVQEYKNKPIISVVDGEYKGVYWKAIYLAYFHFKYNIQFDDSFLLEITQVERVYYNEQDRFEDLVAKLNKRVVRDKIIGNIRSGYISGLLLREHYEYCIRHKIRYLQDVASEYLLSSKDDKFGKKTVIEYLLTFNSTDYFIEELYYQIEEELRCDADTIILKKSPEELVPIMLDKLNRSKELKNRMYATNYLIRCQSYEGLKDYYEWIQTNHKVYSNHHRNGSINSAVGDYKNPEGLEILIEMAAMSLKIDFEDDDFDNLSRNVRKALVTIAQLSNLNVVTVIDAVEKAIDENSDIQNIGFLNYIILEIEEKTHEPLNSYNDIGEAIEVYESLM